MIRKFNNRDLKKFLEIDLKNHKAGKYKNAREVLKLVKKMTGIKEFYSGLIHIKVIQYLNPKSKTLWRDLLQRLIWDRRIKLEIFHHKSKLTDKEKKIKN